MDEELDERTPVGQGCTDNDDKEVLDEAEHTPADTTFERTAIVGILESMSDKVSKVNGEIKDIIEAFKKEVDDEKLGKMLMVKLGAKSAVRSVAEDKRVMAGEWIDIASQKLEVFSTNTKFRTLNSLLKVVLYDIVPYDISYPRPTRVENAEDPTGGENTEVPSVDEYADAADVAPPEADETVGDIPEVPGKGKKSALSVGKYKVTSTIEADGTRKWHCPVENCGKVFGSSGGCHGHINEHIGRVYECPKCLYMGYSLDAYKKHKCFKGWKTQGEVKRKRSVGEKGQQKKQKISSAEGKAPEIEEKVDSLSGATAETVKVKEEKESKKSCCAVGKAPKEIPKERKNTKEVKVEVEDDGIEVIVLD